MVEKKQAKTSRSKSAQKPKMSKKTETLTKAATAKSKRSVKKQQNDELPDDGFIIVDDLPQVDQNRINEERRAYLEEARSQEAFD